MAFEAIQSLVRRAIGQFPDRTAVECPQGRLSYAELDAWAGALAGALRAAGAGAGSLVPVLTEDRRETVAALLGVLRAGCAFVPLDLTAPRVRLEQMLADTAPEVVVTGSAPAAAVGELLAAAAPAALRVAVQAAAPGDPAGDAAGGDTLLRQSDIFTTIEAEGTDGAAGPVREPGPDDPCYVFYTSGSTGRPKGIVGRLSGIDHFIRWETGLLGVGP